MVKGAAVDISVHVHVIKMVSWGHYHSSFFSSSSSSFFLLLAQLGYKTLNVGLHKKSLNVRHKI